MPQTKSKAARPPHYRARCPHCGTRFLQRAIPLTDHDRRAYTREYSREFQRARGAKPRRMPIDEIAEAMRITREDGAVTRAHLSYKNIRQLVHWLSKFNVPHRATIQRQPLKGEARGAPGMPRSSFSIVVPTLAHDAIDALVYGKPQKAIAKARR